ncbi:MAG: hypothetical protein AAFX93_18645 [Verrucomicrobiota bacterium]
MKEGGTHGFDLEEVHEGGVRGADLARYWDVERSYICQLYARKGMPRNPDNKRQSGFRTLAEADAWRAQNAPAIPRRKEAARVSKGSDKPVHDSKLQLAVIDPGSLPDDPRDFADIMLDNAKKTARLAQAMFDQAVSKGDHASVTYAMKNLNEANKNASSACERWLEIQLQQRSAINLDEVMSVVGGILQEVRRYLIKQGEQYCREVNPDNPDHARNVIDAKNDEFFALMDGMMGRIDEELSEPVDEVA